MDYNYTIPEGWKGDEGYKINYVYGGTSFILKGMLVADNLEVSLKVGSISKIITGLDDDHSPKSVNFINGEFFIQ